MKKRVTVFWLIPAKPERELFRKIIRILAREFGAPQFEPHLTLGYAAPGISAASLLRNLFGPPIALRLRSVAYSAKFTKTLFVRFAPNRNLEKVTGTIAKSRKSLQDPHLSLIYRSLPPATKRELAMTIKLPFREVRFDEVKAVDCVSPTQTARDVRSWRVLATRRLSAARTR